MSISYPPAFLNAYLQEKLPQKYRDLFGNNPLNGPEGDLTVPFFPVGPVDIHALTETFPSTQDGLVFAVYDRMFKMRRKPFPHIKSEQVLYYFYKMDGDPARLIEVTQLVHDLLDRGDESAQEVNSWLQAKQKSSNPLTGDQNLPLKPVFFHELKIYQLEETRDIIDFGTARTYAGNKLIIDYDYHVQDYS